MVIFVTIIVKNFCQGFTFNGKHIFTGLMEDLIANTDILNAEQVAEYDVGANNLKNYCMFSSDKRNIDLIGVNSNEVPNPLEHDILRGKK